MRRACILPAILLASPAWAEDAPIVVTAPQAFATPGVRTINEMRSAAASGRIEEVLANAAGLQQFRRSDSRSANPTAQGLTTRALGGNASSRTVVLLDGVPMADPFFGSVPLSALAPDRLGRVTVNRGGAGSFEAGAVAGVVELDSAGADELGKISASALVDDRGDSEIAGSFAPRLGAGYAVVSGRWDRGAGFWTTPASQRVAASVKAKYESWSAGLRAVAPLSPDIELQFRGLLYGDARTLRFAGANSTASGQDASVRLVGSGDWKFEALGYVQARDFSNVVISSTTFRKTLDQYATPATGVGGKLELRPPLGGANDLRIGVNWRSGSGETMEEAFSAATGALTARRRAGGSQSDLGFYAADEITLGALTLNAGARADRYSQSGGHYLETNAAGTITTDNRFTDRASWQGSFRGSAKVKLGAVSLRAAAYTAGRMPTLNELYRPFTVFPVTTRANAALESEKLEGFEGSIDWAPSSQFSLSLTAFDNRVKNAVANVTIANNLRERRNVDAVRAQGLELQAYGWLGPVHLRGSLAWTDAQMATSGASLALNGKRLAQTPRLSASAKVEWAPQKGWNLALMLRHTGAQFEDDLETDLLPAATTLSAYAELPLTKGLSLVLRAENLTNVQVVTRNQAGSIDIGTPRTVWAGMRLGL